MMWHTRQDGDGERRRGGDPEDDVLDDMVTSNSKAR